MGSTAVALFPPGMSLPAWRARIPPSARALPRAAASGSASAPLSTLVQEDSSRLRPTAPEARKFDLPSVCHRRHTCDGSMSSEPLFDLHARSAGVWKSFHESASRRFSIHSGDVWIAQGSRLSETCLRIEMFNGTGLFLLAPDKLSTRFGSITTESRASHRWKYISSAEWALNRTFPELEAATTVAASAPSLRIADESVNASGHVARVAGDHVRDADFHAYGSSAENTSLPIASCRTTYREDGEIRGLENRVLHLKRLSAVLLDGIDLEVETPFWGMPEGG